MRGGGRPGEQHDLLGQFLHGGDPGREPGRHGHPRDPVYRRPEAGPSGVAIDPAAGKIYWTNQFSDEVRVGNLDGTGIAATLFAERRTTRSEWRSPAGKIYWTNLSRGGSGSRNPDGPGTATTLFSGENGPGGVAVDPTANKIYWVTFHGGAVRVGNLNGTGPPRPWAPISAARATRSSPRC